MLWFDLVRSSGEHLYLLPFAVAPASSSAVLLAGYTRKRPAIDAAMARLAELFSSVLRANSDCGCPNATLYGQCHCRREERRTLEYLLAADLSSAEVKLDKPAVAREPGALILTGLSVFPALFWRDRCELVLQALPPLLTMVSLAVLGVLLGLCPRICICGATWVCPWPV